MIALRLRTVLLNIHNGDTLKALEARVEEERLARPEAPMTPSQWSTWLVDEVKKSAGGEQILRAYDMFGKELGPFLPIIDESYAKEFSCVFSRENRLMASRGSCVRWSRPGPDMQQQELRRDVDHLKAWADENGDNIE